MNDNVGNTSNQKSEIDLGDIGRRLSYLETANDVVGSKKEVLKRVKLAKDKLSDLEGKLSELDKKYNSSQILLDGIEKNKSSSDLLIKTLSEDAKKVEAEAEDRQSLLDSTTQINSELIQKQKISSEQIEAIEKTNLRVQKLVAELIEGIKDSEGNTSKASLKDRANDFLKQIDDEYKKSKEQNEHIKKDFEELKLELTNKIESLLPSAAAAGLAFTYSKARSRYDKSISIVFFYILFLAPLVSGAVVYIKKMNGEMTLESFFEHMVYAAPLVAIATFGLLSVRLYRKLYEEYSHKQSVMELYHGFTKEIEESGTADQKQKLIQIMLDTVESKPSLAMDRYEHDEDMDAVPWSKILKLKILGCDPSQKNHL